MSLEALQAIIDLIKYKNVKFVCGSSFDSATCSDILWIQGQYPVIDQGKPRIAKGRRWLIENDWSAWQVATTALKAVITIEEHEVREQFLYKGVSVFYPHYDLDDMVQFRSEKEARKDVV